MECVNCGMDWNVGVGQCEESSWLGVDWSFIVMLIG